MHRCLVQMYGICYKKLQYITYLSYIPLLYETYLIFLFYIQ
jgi:hypothetical protein